HCARAVAPQRTPPVEGHVRLSRTRARRRRPRDQRRPSLDDRERVVGWGDALVLAGVFSFVLYGLGAAQFTDFSPLRYTTLTAALGWLTIAAATAIALAAGLVPTPSGSTLAAT